VFPSNDGIFNVQDLKRLVEWKKNPGQYLVILEYMEAMALGVVCSDINQIEAAMMNVIDDRWQYVKGDVTIGKDHTGYHWVNRIFVRLQSEHDMLMLKLIGIPGCKIECYTLDVEKPYWQKYCGKKRNTIPYDLPKTNHRRVE
jgi:hypothetical protein